MDLKQRALEWAERNSSPGIKGRDELYELLISVQAAAYEAGFRDGQMPPQDYGHGHTGECQPNCTCVVSRRR